MKLNVPGFLTIGRFIFGDAQTLAQTPIRRVHRFIYKVVAAAAVLGLTAMTAYAGAPYPTANAPKPVDMGPFISNQAISVTIALKLRHPQDAEALLRELNKPGDPQFHKFLTSDQFDAKFGPTEADVEKVSASLRRYGLKVERASSLTLRVTGSPANLEAAFRVHLHQFGVPAQGGTPAYSFRAPLEQLTVPSEIAELVNAALGMDDRPSFRPHNLRAPTALVPLHRKNATAAAAGNPPGSWTVTDFASYYDVNPLYAKGVNGSGRTMGIVTFASFTPSDAFAYWSAVGLSVDPNRITVVNVDGGPGAPSDISGSSETTLDVEQSGGIAPSANIIVYQAPNTGQGFLDAFASAIDANIADSISVSWGSWEWEDNLANAPVTDPFSGKTVATLQAVHEQFIKAALQGQSMFASAGDDGAYDVFCPSCGTVPPDFTIPLSVDYPGSDPAITAAGGTTLAGTQTITNQFGTFVINVPAERVWGWDYLEPACGNLSPLECGIYPAGGGGGVSVFFPVPLYQLLLAGVQISQPGQAYIEEDVTPPDVLFSLPANFPGRNVPDVSMNADPQTGYVLYYTSSVSGFHIETGGGGTSFVAPQLNGVTALMDQNARHRLGLLNYALYPLAHFPTTYAGSHAPLRYIIDGDNWFYSGRQGYSPAAGVGTIDVANLAQLLQ